MNDSGWECTLDAFEQRLHAQEVALALGSLDPVAEFEPPAAPTALPTAFLHRATELVARCRALEDALATALATALTDHEQAKRSAAAPAQPVYFDSRV